MKLQAVHRGLFLGAQSIGGCVFFASFIILLHHHTITPSHHHTITPSHHHTITPSATAVFSCNGCIDAPLRGRLAQSANLIPITAIGSLKWQMTALSFCDICFNIDETMVSLDDNISHCG
ncbi:MAG: hypothetical protein ACRC4U_11580 [Shewanella sp.]